MKKTRTILSIMLVIIMMFQTSTLFASPGQVGGLILHETVNHATGLVEEVYAYGGSIFYFRMTDEYTYSSQLTPLGYYVFAFRWGDNSEILTGTFSAIESGLLQHSRVAVNQVEEAISMSSLVMSNLDAFVTEVIEFASEEHQYELLIVDDNRMEHFDSAYQTYDWEMTQSIAPMSNVSAFPAPPPSGRVFSNLNTLIAMEFPGQYTSRHLQSLSDIRGGRIGNARLYESYTAFVSSRMPFGGIANLALATISLMLGLPVTGLMSLISVIVSSIGVVLAAPGAFINRLDVVQSFTRRVRVNSEAGIMFWSAHDTRWEVLEGDIGAQLNATSGRVNAFWDFHDIPHLLRTGLDNWFRINNIW